MLVSDHAVELGTILSDLGSSVQLLSTNTVDLTRPVHGAVVWVPGDPVPEDTARVVVCTGLRAGVQDAFPLLDAKGSRVILLCDASDDAEALSSELELTGDDIVGLVGLGAGEAVSCVTRSGHSAEEAVSRRLGSLQRSLSLALADPTPIPTLLNRLKRVCNATAALIDRHGEILYATGPVPRTLLFTEISSTRADTQTLTIDGWYGLAARIADPSSPQTHTGWLLVISRHPGFPDGYATSAVHVAASLVETNQRMGILVRQQERAVRAAVLEQTLALRRERHDAELAARVAGLGITFDSEARVGVASFARSPRSEQRQQAADTLANTMSRLLAEAGHPALITARGDGVTFLVQCGVTALQRLLAADHNDLSSLQIGIGRPVSAVGFVVDSYHDAQLAVRTLRRVAQEQQLMAYEDFDFATRLFADVGLDRMVAWAKDFLRPLAERGNLLAGLRSYVEHDQNINVAAEALSIHHNSLRYRLAKVEELLTINLKQPAAISSVFLALTAVDLTRQADTLRPRATRSHDELPVGEIGSAQGATQFGSEGHGGLGVIFDPDR
ncbi:PucR family transcriptional regulator [Streptomyces sp. MB09-02B]|uniref:PucR family transcriptional regulator n=1 Tax=Streptomyces sp. MB09-02B TaxID=3028667 RepID=UPI0029B32A2E|nr:helix-turn-helix domain-containing protein [Streptomyces sp. MB09-02B]MDX3640509.1 helix-turn-helix domain-containing protein [Streptomyces sp. MB09-02B]